MPRKRKEKGVPPHLEALPPVATSEDGNGPDVEAWHYRVCPSPGQHTQRAGLSNAMMQEIHIQQQRHESLIEEKRDLYQETGNPLYAWDAYALCRKRNRAVPEWFQGYLDDIASKMLQTDRVPSDLPEILGFMDSRKRNGGAQTWEQYTRATIQQQAIAIVVDFLKNEPGITIEDACAMAFNVLKDRWSTKRGSKTLFSEQSILDWYKKYSA